MAVSRSFGAFLQFLARNRSFEASFQDEFDAFFGQPFPEALFTAERFDLLARESRDFAEFERRFEEEAGFELTAFIDEAFFADPSRRAGFIARTESAFASGSPFQSFLEHLDFLFGFRSGAAA